MLLKKLTIEGFRGFSETTVLNFSLPDKVTPGSGLTVLVGPNNSGKSTIIEAIHLLTSNSDIIPSSARNILTDGKVKIEVENEIGMTRTIQSTDNKGAFIKKIDNGKSTDFWVNNLDTFILSSKRAFSSTFHNNNYQSRENYKGNVNDTDYRSENNINSNFGGRLLTIFKNRKKFDDCLKKVLNPLPNWTIEAFDNNSLYLEFSFDKVKHSSKGAGDGYINIFNIIDALYDSNEKNVIIIDEPEISLHPDLQRKLFKLLVEYSKDKQVIISTHSPYFVDWSLFSKKAKIIRLKKEKDNIMLYELTQNTKEGILGILKDYQKPHTLSLNANEIFFLNDDVILTEGQDDVLCYQEIFKKNNYLCPASFFGWGAGGAPQFKNILNILNDLGYEKVFVIIDNDQKEIIKSLQDEFTNYNFFAIDADDVRNKKIDNKIINIINEIKELNCNEQGKEKLLNNICNKYEEKIGLVKNMNNFEINLEYQECIDRLIESLKKYFVLNLENNESKKTTLNNNEKDNSSEKAKAEIKLNEWVERNNINNYCSRKYNKLEFKGGSGGILSIKNISLGKYYMVIEQTESLSQECSITINFHLIIDLNKNKVKLKDKKIVKNTLPISKTRKLIEKILY